MLTIVNFLDATTGKKVFTEMKKFFLTIAAVATLGLSACVTNSDGSVSKQNMGAVTGAVLGGLAGSQVGKGSGQLWATGVGVLLGSMMGSEVGKSLDQADRMYMQKAETRAVSAPVGETISWNNPDSGNSGTIVAVRDGTSTSGRYCREYQTTVTVGGQKEQGYGTACQQPDGSWQIVK